MPSINPSPNGTVFLVAGMAIRYLIKGMGAHLHSGIKVVSSVVGDRRFKSSKQSNQSKGLHPNLMLILA